MEIRELVRSELVSLYPLCPSGVSWADEYYLLRKNNYNPDIHVYACYCDSALIGELTVYESSSPFNIAEKGNSIFLSAWRVLKNYRNRGYGTALMKYVLFQFKKHGYKEAFLCCDNDNDTEMSICNKLGFKEVHARSSNYNILKKEL